MPRFSYLISLFNQRQLTFLVRTREVQVTPLSKYRDEQTFASKVSLVAHPYFRAVAVEQLQQALTAGAADT